MSAKYRGLGHSFGGGHCAEKQTSRVSWANIIEGLNAAKISPLVMQSNMDFTLAGSVSANCHGWQANVGPIGTALSKLTIDRGDGEKVPTIAERSAVIGGWGLCGEIKEVVPVAVPNYKVRSMVSSSWAELVVSAPFAYTDMLNIHLDSGWNKAVVNQHFYVDKDNPVISELRDEVSWWAPKLVRYFPKLRWFAQTNMNLHKISSRNELLYTSVRHFTWPNQELFECFVPTENAVEFVRRGREKIQKMHVFNTTVRDIQDDNVSMLPYAKGPTRGFVVLCDKQHQNAEAIRTLYDIAIELGGSYYLPYNRYATVDQFRRAYPRWEEFKTMMVSESAWSKKYIGALDA